MSDPVLVYSRFPKSLMVRIGEKFELIDAAGKPPSTIFAKEQLANVRAIITAGGQALGGDVMDMLPKLGAIVCYGTGYDGVDLKAAKARKILVGNSPAANASAVADLAMTLMLAVTRRIIPADQYVRSGGWASATPSPQMTPLMGMPGAKIGVYGMGAIGRKIASRAAAFEMDVGYFNRTKYGDLPYTYYPTLEKLVEWCDILMVAVRAGADTQHIINAGMLKKLGPNGTIVNISRGSTIDQKALIAALRDKAIAGAGLDVYEVEPHKPDALSEFPNVVVTPHIGGHTIQSHIAMQDCVIANLTAFFANKGMANPVM